jgi:hypothetical protein
VSFHFGIFVIIWLWEGLFGNWLRIYIIKKTNCLACATHTLACQLSHTFWAAHETSYDGHTMAFKVAFNLSRLRFHPGTMCVPNGCLVWLVQPLFFPFSSLISMLAMEKLEAVFHFLIFSYLVPNLLITIYFIWDGLWNWIFFSIPSSFKFLSKFGLHSFNWYLFYLRWFLDLFLISSF